MNEKNVLGSVKFSDKIIIAMNFQWEIKAFWNFEKITSLYAVSAEKVNRIHIPISYTSLDIPLMAPKFKDKSTFH